MPINVDSRKIFDKLVPEVLRLHHHYRSHLKALDVSVKDDKTLLTNADIGVQELIIRTLREHTPEAGILAEEDSIRLRSKTHEDCFWVIDPIDGTKEFVQPTAVEFCTVVAWVQEYRPVDALIVAPELGPNRSPIVVMGFGQTGEIFVNGKSYAVPGRQVPPHSVSATRSAGTKERDFEVRAVNVGIKVKTRTTSQSLDMLRLVIDVCDNAFPNFDLFYRENQKVWDGAAGYALAEIAGFHVCDKSGNSVVPLGGRIFDIPELSSVVAGPAANVKWLCAQLASST